MIKPIILHEYLISVVQRHHTSPITKKKKISFLEGGEGGFDSNKLVQPHASLIIWDMRLWVCMLCWVSSGGTCNSVRFTTQRLNYSYQYNSNLVDVSCLVINSLPKAFVLGKANIVDLTAELLFYSSKR